MPHPPGRRSLAFVVAFFAALSPLAAPPAAADCAPDEQTLCLLEGRFAVQVTWRTLRGREGVGRPVPLTDQTGAFWFFDAANYELMVKMVDGRRVNGRFWVFFGALSNVEYTVRVTDTETGAAETYHNPQGHLYGLADVRAFPGGAGDVCGGIAGEGCTDDLFCELPPGNCCCDFQGVCTPFPDSCPEVFDPVCGCDGVTYPNDCHRQMAGVSLDHAGPC